MYYRTNSILGRARILWGSLKSQFVWGFIHMQHNLDFLLVLAGGGFFWHRMEFFLRCYHSINLCNINVDHITVFSHSHSHFCRFFLTSYSNIEPFKNSFQRLIKYLFACFADNQVFAKLQFESEKSCIVLRPLNTAQNFLNMKWSLGNCL